MSLKNIIRPTTTNNICKESWINNNNEGVLDSFSFHFESVLDCADLKSLFIEFLKMNQTYESLQFVEKVQEYMTLHSDKNRFKKAQEIVVQFIRVGSESELNTIMSLRNEVEDAFSKCSEMNCPIDLFKKLFMVMLVSLKEDPFMRFTKWANFREKVIELVVNDQSFLLDLCFHNPENEQLIAQYTNEKSEERQKLLVDVRRRSPIGVPLYPIKVKSGKIFKQSKTYMCFTGYDLVNWISGYFRINRDSALKVVHNVLQVDHWIESVNAKHSNTDLVEDSRDKYYRFATKKRLVVIGGGYAGSYLCKAMQDEFDVVLIDKKPRFESPLSFNRLVYDPSHYDRISSEHGSYLTKGRIYLGKVEHITPYYVQLPTTSVQAQEERIYFDYLVVSTGSSYIQFPVEVIEKPPVIINPYDSSSLIQNNAALKQAKSIVCVGGGPVAVEMAGDIAHHYPQTQVTILTSSERLMERTSPTVHENVVKYLTSYDNVTIHTETKVHKIRDSSIIYSSVSGGSEEKVMPFDVALVCVGFVPNTQLFQSHMSTSLDSFNRVKVTQHFNVKFGEKPDEFYENIFALGDITDMDEEKLAQSAHKNASKLSKILPIIEGHETCKKVKSMEYVPKKRIMIVSVGPKKGIMIRDSQVILENALLLKAKAVAEYQTMRGVK